MPKLFPGSFAKVERAEAQINDLNARLAEFFDTRPYEAFSELNPEGTEEVWKHRLSREIPVIFSVLAGEVLFNIRSALDQMACALAVMNGKSTIGVAFPFGRDAQHFETELGLKAKKLHPDASDMIRAMKPYSGGDELLWLLHDLNRRDKHIELVPVALGFGGLNASEVKFFTGRLIRLGPRLGSHMLRSRISGDMFTPDGGQPPVLRKVGEDWHVEFGISDRAPPHEQMDFLTCTPNAKFHANIKPTFNVAFGDVEVLKTEPVVAVLHQMRQLAEGILLAFDSRFG